MLRLILIATALLALTIFSTAPASASSYHRCNLKAFASGELVVKGVSCKRGERVINAALRRPGCTPSAEDAELGRGCYASTRFGKWRCSGLFPGGGFDLKCRSGRLRVHGGAGG